MPIRNSGGTVTYSAPNNKAMLDQTGCQPDNDFAVVGKDDDLKQVKVSIAGTTDTVTTLAFAPSASRTVTFPDATGTLQIVAAPQYSAPSTGNSVAMTSNTLIIEPAGTLAALTVTLPAGTIDGQIVRISTTQIITTLTLSAAGSDTIVNAVTTFSSANSFVAYVYRLSTTKWYRIG